MRMGGASHMALETEKNTEKGMNAQRWWEVYGWIRKDISLQPVCLHCTVQTDSLYGVCIECVSRMFKCVSEYVSSG